jgi:phosphatidylserine/phosphatidylglycerophosphate/cardiolipin synthase-like enzyme
MSKYTVVPICTKVTNSATTSLKWFVQKTEYHPVPTCYQPLINGEDTFREVHLAIAKAKKTVDIICWGFQPSMYFIRNGKEPSIGELLVIKAKEGIKVRVLGWAMTPLGINVTGVSDESNLPGYGTIGYKNRAGQTASNDQYAYDKKWYSQYGDGAKPWKVAQENWCQPLSPRLGIPLRFIGRGFDTFERAEIYYRAKINRSEKEISGTTQVAFAGSVTHHQKMVLVDYELPESACGFVMGHNMLDEYWDTNAHSIQRYKANLGANGNKPRQDISSKVNGPILEHLHHNFATAWQKETGEDLMSLRKAKEAGAKLCPRPDGTGTLLMAQILRTQSQSKKPIRDIEKLYLQAANNSLGFIYLENQYFRWTKLAEKIKAAAANLAKGKEEHGADAGKYPPVHLFVVTNSSDEGVGPGTVNTYKMMDSLGKAENIPGVTKQMRLNDTEKALQQARTQQHLAQIKNNNASRTNVGLNPNSSLGKKAQKALDAERQQANQELAAAKQTTAELEKKQAELKDPDYSVHPESRTGLKVVVCTLVAPDSSMKTSTLPDAYGTYRNGASSQGERPVPRPLGSLPSAPQPTWTPWTPVYIHSKLMIINDVFTTHGSANINVRSMEVDSELNIAHEKGSVTQKMRRDLWTLHTKGRGAQDDPVKAFKEWGKIISNNKDAQSQHKPPVASLIEFYRDDPTLSDQD